jgi:hypothetical protein
MATPEYAGGCMCGAVRYQAQGVARNLCFCHCSSCRRSAGAPLVAWVSFARGDFSITHGTLTEYRSSAQVSRGFCALCGTSLTYRHAARDGETDVTLGSFDDPRRLAPEMHVWVAEKLPWLSIDDGRVQHRGGFPPS